MNIPFKHVAGDISKQHRLCLYLVQKSFSIQEENGLFSKLLFVYIFCWEKISQLKVKFKKVFSKPNQETLKQNFLSLENKGYIGHNASKYKNNSLDNRKDGRYDLQEVWKKDSKRQFPLNQKDKFLKFSPGH